MKTFLIIVIFITIFTSCSTNNAFSHFDIDEKQAKSEDSLKSSKIFNGNINEGIVNIIYLNQVLPEQYNDKEYFYVYLYTKKHTEKINYFLNNESSVDVTVLKSHNEFSELTSFSGDWQRYYLVVFNNIEKDVITFEVKTSQGSSRKITFQKEN